MVNMMYVLFIASILSIPICVADIPSICGVCECLEVSLVECDGIQLTHIPDVEGNDILHLSFSGNSITTITPFTRMESLQKLSFRFNSITTIENSAFSGLPVLTMLDLSYNNISSNTFDEDQFIGPENGIFDEPISSLKCLNLSSNHLERLTKNMFRRLTNLSILSLRNNPLQDLSPGSVLALGELPNLQELDLAYTGLRRLPSHVFADLRNLRTLDLSGNNFEHVPTEINFVPSLRNLILNSLIWTSIQPEYIHESLQNLESLSINHSPLLTTIEDYAFANLSGLRRLDITHNPHLSNLQEFSLSTVLNYTLAIDEVKLTHNHLQTLPQSAIEWSSFSKLDLQHNPWNCDCNFEWIAKGLIPRIATNDTEIVLNVVCASPVTMMGKSVISREVQRTKFVCYDSLTNVSVGSSFLILMIVSLGVLLLATGTVFFSYALFRRTQNQDWIGSHIQYRRVNEPVTPITK